MKRDSLIEILKSEFDRKKARNAAYSLRSYARDLSVDASNLSKIMSAQKTPGLRLRKKLAVKMGLSELETQQLLGNEPLKLANTDDEHYRNHSLEIFEIVSRWHHYAILELFKLRGFIPAATEISKRLPISKIEAQQCLKRLVSVGLLEPDENGRLRPTEESSSSILNTSTSKAHRNQQREILEGAIDALETVPLELRSQSSMTMAIDSRKLDEARALIKEFRRNMGRLLSKSDQLNEVYQLSISLYPITNQSKGKT